MKSYGSKQAVRIAFAQSHNGVKEDNRPQRWTECAVFYDPTPEKPGKRWIAVTLGCSSYPGETTRENFVQVGSLDRALEFFGHSSLRPGVQSQAKDWEETELPELAEQPSERPEFANQEEALAWLYGPAVKDMTIAGLLSRDFGAGESTVRAAVAAGRDIKIPLLAALRFIDRDLFRLELETRANG